MQQGRVQLDADMNEESAIRQYFLQALAADLIGPHGGPRGNVGFKIEPIAENRKDFTIGTGRYYVQGILCENEPKLDADGQPIQITYLNQPDYPDPPKLPGLPYLVYLDVWEQHLTHVQDALIREVALGGPDTASRAKIVWQIKVHQGANECLNDEKWSELVSEWQPVNRGRLRAGTKEFEVDDSTEPCTISPESKYRGAENQLYRVEIHEGGPADTATFKWSRENGSVVFPILSLNNGEVTLEHLGRDERFGLRERDWVEIVDDEAALQEVVYPLVQVKSVDNDRMIVTLESPQTGSLPDYPEHNSAHPMLRRWDHKQLDTTLGYPQMAKDGALRLEEGNWLLLEDGIQVVFAAAPANERHIYRTGDYWFIPARTATGDVEWPGQPDDPEARPPHGVQHAYAPLAIFGRAGAQDCRREFMQLWKSPPD
jgi:hypothetical protein